MQTTRRKILAFLEAHPPASARTISQGLRMTAANIRHHLQRLEADNLVEVIKKDQAGGRGRPTLLYGLTHRAARGDLRLLTTALWEELLEDLNEERGSKLFHRLAVRILGKEADLGGSLTQRLYSAVRLLRSLEYDARWEAHADSPQVILEHCPFAALRPDLPEICSLDREILSILLGHTVEQIAERQETDGVMSPCIFRVPNP